MNNKQYEILSHIKRKTFAEASKWYREQGISKHFIFTIKQLKEGNIDEELKELDWSCVYCICDEIGKLQYVGKSKDNPMGRIRTHIEEGINGKRLKDGWAVILIYSKLWVYTHEWAEREIIENYSPILNTQHKRE